MSDNIKMSDNNIKMSDMNSRNLEKIVISPEKKEKILNNLRQVL